MIRLLLAYGPAAFWATALLILGGQDSLPVGSLPFSADKVGHFVLYAVLGGLAAWGWQRAGRRPAGIWLALAVLFVAGCDEVHQGSVAGRSAEIADWVADALGSMIAFGWASRAIERRRELGERRGP